MHGNENLFSTKRRGLPVEFEALRALVLSPPLCVFSVELVTVEFANVSAIRDSVMTVT